MFTFPRAKQTPKLNQNKRHRCTLIFLPGITSCAWISLFAAVCCAYSCSSAALSSQRLLSSPAVVVAAAASSPSLRPPRPSLPPPSSPPLLLQPRHTVKRPIKRALAVVNSNAAAGLGCAVRARLTQPRLAAAAVAAELVSILCVITPRSGDVAVTWRMRSSIMAPE